MAPDRDAGSTGKRPWAGACNRHDQHCSRVVP